MEDYKSEYLTILEKKLDEHSFYGTSRKKVFSAVERLLKIDESETFSYTPLEKFEEKLPRIKALKRIATDVFRPFVKKDSTLCQSMGVPLSNSLKYAADTGKTNAFHEIFAITNHKAINFMEKALMASIEGEKNMDLSESYNTAFDRGTPWTYWNEVRHMDMYARYHFNSYVLGEFNEDVEENPFHPVISLYEEGANDFIFMRTDEEGKEDERLATFHTVDVPDKGKVLGVHFYGDKNLKYYRKWGEHYMNLRSVSDGEVKMKVLGIADLRYVPADMM